jgi:microcystin-dependent protein
MPDLSYTNAAPDVLLDTRVTTNTGTSQPISIMKPYLGVNYIISLYGYYPSQN